LIGFIAKKLCPNLIFLECNFDKYIKAANIIRGVIEVYDPSYHCGSLDEVYFDVTNVVKQRVKDNNNNNDDDNLVELWSTAAIVVEEIRAKITQETNGLTCSAGIANNSMLAKIASNLNKPNGQYLLQPSRQAIMSFMMNLPTRKVPGIGKVFETILDAISIKTMGDVHKDFYKILKLFSPKTIAFLSSACLGISSDGKEEIEGGLQKSIGKSQTFGTMSKHHDQLTKLKEICKELFDECQRGQIVGSTVTLKLKTDKFKESTRSKTYPYHIKTLSQLEDAAIALLAAEQPISLRLIGVTLSKLYSKSHEKTSSSSSSSLQHFFKQKDTTKDNNSKGVSEGIDEVDYIFEDYQDIDIDNHNDNDNDYNDAINVGNANNDGNGNNYGKANNDGNGNNDGKANDGNGNNDGNDKSHQDNDDVIESKQNINKVEGYKVGDNKTVKKKENDIVTAFTKSKKQKVDEWTCWTCEVCTYNHSTKEESTYLQCLVCLEPRQLTDKK